MRSVQDIASIDGFTIAFSGARDLATLALDSQGTPVVAIQTASELSVVRVGPSSVATLASFTATSGVVFGQQTEIAIDGQDRPHIVWWQSGEEPGTACHAVRS